MSSSVPPWAPSRSLDPTRAPATGVGSLPGTDPAEAAKVVAGELDGFVHLAELPAAGVGADLIGRAAAHLVGLHVETAPSGWRLVERPAGDERRARALLARDLDLLEEYTQGYAGPLKIQCAGPWTLAAALELRGGHKAVRDPGAVRDLTAALAEGLGEAVRDVVRRVPGAQPVVQLDEPSLPAVLTGLLGTVSGFGRLPAIDRGSAVEMLGVVAGAVEAAGATPIAHCCAARPPVDVLVDAGMRAVSVDATLLGPADDDQLGEAIESGADLFLGLVPALDGAPLPSVGQLAAPARRLWSRLGFAPAELAHRVVVTPTCGLAGASITWPPVAYRACVEVGRALAEDPEGGAA